MLDLKYFGGVAFFQLLMIWNTCWFLLTWWTHGEHIDICLFCVMNCKLGHMKIVLKKINNKMVALPPKLIAINLKWSDWPSDFSEIFRCYEGFVRVYNICFCSFPGFHWASWRCWATRAGGGESKWCFFILSAHDDQHFAVCSFPACPDICWGTCCSQMPVRLSFLFFCFLWTVGKSKTMLDSRNLKLYFSALKWLGYRKDVRKTYIFHLGYAGMMSLIPSFFWDSSPKEILNFMPLLWLPAHQYVMCQKNY